METGRQVNKETSKQENALSTFLPVYLSTGFISFRQVQPDPLGFGAGFLRQDVGGGGALAVLGDLERGAGPIADRAPG